MRRVGVPTGDRLLDEAVATDAVNQAQAEIDGEGEWPWCEVIAPMTLPAGKGFITMPDDWRKTRTVVDTASGVELLEMASSDLLSSDPSAGPDAPGLWAMSGDVMLLRAIPSKDVALTVLY